MTNVQPSPAARLIDRTRQHTVGDLLRRTAARYPNKSALIAGDVRMSYQEFDDAVNRAGHNLTSRGVTRGDRLALLSHNSIQYVILAFAAAKLGVVLVPINFMLNASETAYILEHSGASALVAEDTLVPVAEQAIAIAGMHGVRGCIGQAGDGWENADDWWKSGCTVDLDIVVGDDDPLRLMYTSGTESRPKGVVLTSRSLIAQYSSCAIDGEASADDIEIHAMPLYHCAQLDCFLSVDVYVGATNVILRAPEPVAILSAIAGEKATKLFCPPPVWISVLRQPDLGRWDLSTLTKGYYGASPMPVQVLQELMTTLPGVRWWNFYGQTEMSPVATILRPEEQLTHTGSAGRAAINVQTMVVDEDDRPVAPGVVGEIVHRSPHASLGYYRDEQATAHAYRNGWLHSGDLGVLDEQGYLTVVDRKKDMIKTGGENVASREVEEAIYRLEGVAEVAVFGIPDPRWIEAVTAVVVTTPGANLTPDAVHRHSRQHLAGYKCPKHIVFADALPKNPSGKVLKRELRLQYGELVTTRPQHRQPSEHP